MSEIIYTWKRLSIYKVSSDGVQGKLLRLSYFHAERSPRYAVTPSHILGLQGASIIRHDRLEKRSYRRETSLG
jgi:hypothetical protein